MQEFAVINDLQNFCKCTALLATKIVVSFCKCYSNYLQFRYISMLMKQQYFNMLNCVKLIYSCVCVLSSDELYLSHTQLYRVNEEE